jgi:SP family xylose:H+ symportor-like MFS transporter
MSKHATIPAGSATDLTYVWRISLVAALGELLFGYDWVVTSGADLFYENYFHLVSASEVGWTKSCVLVSGGLSNRLGRKRLLLLSALLFAVSSVGTGLASVYLTFVTWRIIGGVAIGLAPNLRGQESPLASITSLPRGYLRSTSVPPL